MGQGSLVRQMAGMRRLSQLFKAKQAEMAAKLLASQEMDHPSAKGNASEENWRELLRSYLPARYAVEGGFVIDADGMESQQIDLIIFDRQYSPLLFESGGVLYVPAECVYGVFEVKQFLNKQHVKYAAEKVASVRRLRRTSVSIVHAGGEFSPREPPRIVGGILCTGSVWRPALGEPLLEALTGLGEEHLLDIGCALQDGVFVTDRRGGHVKTTDSQDDLSLVFFIFWLLDLLQRMGTVPAIDYAEWLANGEQRS